MILFIDCYDSFSYNLTHLIEKACGVKVAVVHNDGISPAELKVLLPKLHAVVIGPGPGDPHNSSDCGVIKQYFELASETPVPTMGICFGYQSLVLAFGGSVERMHPPRHGRISPVQITHESPIFANLSSGFEVVRYHSLCCKTGGSQLRCTAVAGDGVEMAAEHPLLPFYGVQFHPESVKSMGGETLFANFWKVACGYNKATNRSPSPKLELGAQLKYRPLLANDFEKTQFLNVHVERLPKLRWETVAELLKPHFVLLKSAAPPGTHSIFGLLEPNSTIHLRAKGKQVYLGVWGSQQYTLKSNKSFWELAAEFMQEHKLKDEDVDKLNAEYGLPFYGGLIGYVSYEGACLETVNQGVQTDSKLNSDFSFVYIQKSVILDEESGDLFAVGPKEFTESFAKKVASAVTSSNSTALPKIAKPKYTRPSFEPYANKFKQCVEKLESGDSYELCLTTQTKLEFPTDVEPFKLFKLLVAKNPAPYCAYMDFDDCLLATSPERFVYFDKKHCEFRPIKGTVRKGNGMTAARANEILSTEKEQAENLMIVDLIRHDVGHLLQRVTTPQLMVVEEYHSVFQLVTSVCGYFNKDSKVTGLDILSQSLPPGSMTGAPKQRSCEILRQIEEEPRGLYSGVQGYIGVDGRGDFSVIIRSLFRSKADFKKSGWQLGAGGAVTVLSTVRGEYDELQTKLDSVLNVFE